MSLATVISIVFRTSVTLLVFALGLRVSFQETRHLIRRPSLLVRSVVSMNVVMPLFAAALVTLFDLNPAIKVALILLSISPVPPLLPKRELKAGGGSSFTFSLLVTEAVLAILFVPISVEVLGAAFGKQARVSTTEIALVVLISVLIPLGVGMLFRRTAPALADRIAKPISLIATFLLASSLIPALFVAMPAVVSLIGDGTLAALTAFILAGLAAGHMLGGPEPENRTVLALATASRHPAVALTTANSSFPEEKLVLAAIILYLIVNALLLLPYIVWRRRLV